MANDPNLNVLALLGAIALLLVRYAVVSMLVILAVQVLFPSLSWTYSPLTILAVAFLWALLRPLRPDLPK